MNEIEVRKIPKKTIIIMVIICVVFIGVFFVLLNLKDQKAVEMLHDIGYTNIKDVSFVNKIQAEDKDTRKKVNIIKVKFFDVNQNKTCIGFIQRLDNNKYKKDFACK